MIASTLNFLNFFRRKRFLLPNLNLKLNLKRPLLLLLNLCLWKPLLNLYRCPKTKMKNLV